MNARSLILATFCTAVSALTLAGAPAQAAVTHKYISQLTGFSDPTAVAFDAAGDAYVVDTAAKTVDRFSPAGIPLSFSASESYVEGSKLTGTPTGVGGSLVSFEEPQGVAVNEENGEVYVSDGAEHVVDVFSSTGQYLSQLTGTPPGAPVSGPFNDPYGLTVDQSTHDLYITDPHSGVVDVFSSTGAYVSQFGAGVLGGNFGESVAVNDLSEDAYVGDSGPDVVYTFNSLGSFVPPEWHGASTPNGSFGNGHVYVGMDQSNGHLYVASTADRVVGEFNSSTSEEYLDQLTGTPAGPFNRPQAVAVNPSNGDVYVADASGVVDIFGPDTIVFGTTVQAPSSVSETTATLNGSVTPAGVQVSSCEFEYGTSTSYGQSAACEPTPAHIGIGNTPVMVTAPLSGLQANTTYDYRLNAANADGSNASSDGTFTTPGPPKVDSVSAEVRSTEKAGQTNATLQAQITPDGRETTYNFEYGETKSYGTSVPIPAGTVGSGEEPVGVPAAELASLKIGTTYHYRIVAGNEYGTVDGPDQEFTTVPPALVEASVSDVAATSATLEAQINPLGSETHYYFQYGTTSCTTSPTSCTSVPSPPGVDIGSAETPQNAESVHIQGLQPATVYHYRVLATNALGAFAPERTFTTQAAGSEFALPDGREWELVSPPNKHGAGIEPIAYGGAPTQASEEGGAFTYAANGPLVANPQGNRAPQFAQIISTRGADGWTTQDIATPYSVLARLPGSRNTEYDLFSGNLSVGLVQPEGEGALPPLQEGAEKTIYLRNNTECEPTPTETIPATCYLPLVTAANVPPGKHFGEVDKGNVIEFDDASPDLSHIVLGSEEALTPNAGETNGEDSLYEWAGGSLRLVSLLPPNEKGEEKPAAESGEAAYLGGYGSQLVRNAISSDGSRIVWEAGGHLYLRDMSRGETIQLDVPQPEAEDELASPEPVFQGASSGGSKIFFTDQQRLTKDSKAKEREPDLYMFEVTSGSGEPLKGELTDLTKDANPKESADVQGDVLGYSEDGSWVYFVANGVLADGAEHGASPGNCELIGVAGEGTCNLYVWHDGVTGLVTPVSGEDEPDWAARSPSNLGNLTARVSPNGRYLEFMSDRSLTGYDNRDVNSGVPDEEVYLYNGETERLACASCDPTGARPEGVLDSFEAYLLIDHPRAITGIWLAGSVPGWTEIEGGHALYQSRYLSNEGRLFFNGADSLVPGDVNHKEDVYEYEPEGVGPQAARCGPDTQSASAVFKPARVVEVEGKEVEEGAGCVGLISSGTSSLESAFLEASGKGPGGEEGEEVFFLTASPLVAQDTDSAYDVYDAHICSQISPCPASAASVPPACSDADSCRAAPTPQPTIFGAPSSETFSGAGNLKPTSTTAVKAKAKPLTRAQKLANALKACRKDKSKKKRAMCEKRARKKYGPVSKAKKSRSKGGK
ncbi:MAG: hypothetical protein WA708_20240 [Acidobacteriaceae bacterium]